MMPVPPNLLTSATVPTFSIIQRYILEVFNKQPCLWQMKVVEAILRGDKDVLCIAGTGMGKTLTFALVLARACPRPPLTLDTTTTSLALVHISTSALARHVT